MTALYDICNAFPTIAHLWLFAVLACIRLNPLVYRLIQMLYYNSEAFSYGTGTGDFLFHVLSGVRTGCPLSATLFLIALNYFLIFLNGCQTAQNSLPRACVLMTLAQHCVH